MLTPCNGVNHLLYCKGTLFSQEHLILAFYHQYFVAHGMNQHRQCRVKVTRSTRGGRKGKNVPGSALCVRFSRALQLEQIPILFAPLQTCCICGAGVTLPFYEGEAGSVSTPASGTARREMKKPNKVSLAVYDFRTNIFLEKIFLVIAKKKKKKIVLVDFYPNKFDNRI